MKYIMILMVIDKNILIQKNMLGSMMQVGLWVFRWSKFTLKPSDNMVHEGAASLLNIY